MTRVNLATPVILVILVNPVTPAMEHVKHANHVIVVNVFVILVKGAITFVRHVLHAVYWGCEI